MKILGNRRFRKREFAVKLGEKPCQPGQRMAISMRRDLIAGLVDGYGAWDGLSDKDVGSGVVVQFPDGDGYRRRTRGEKLDLEGEQNVSNWRFRLDCLSQVHSRNGSRRGRRQRDGAIEAKAGDRINVAWVEIDALDGSYTGVSDLYR